MSRNIYQRINEARRAVGYVQKDASVQGYKAVTHDAVTAMLRDQLIEQGIIVVPTVIKSKVRDAGQTSSGTPILRYEGRFFIAFVNEDDPSERVPVEIDAHANDYGDKAPGKALSYATKYAMLKLFSLETGEDDESRIDIKAKQDIPAHKFQVYGGKYDGMSLGELATKAGRAGLGYVCWLARSATDPLLKEKAAEVWEKHRPDMTDDQVSDELLDAESTDELTGLWRCLTKEQETAFKDQFKVRRDELSESKPKRTTENARG